jgi:integral membrane sensor domain MASE1
MFDIGDFPLFKGIIGPKNSLPITMGMILGPFGAFGMLAGSITAGILSGAGALSLISESAGAVIMSAGGWLLWYAKKGTGGIALKKLRDLLRFTVISLILSALCASIAYLCGEGFLMTFISYMVWNLLLGISLIMLLTSIFCVNVVYPPWHPIIFDINETLPLKTESVTVILDIIDELCFSKKLDRKRAIFMQSYIEECIIMILSEPTCKNLRLTVQISDCISIVMQYDGNRCNPLRMTSYEDQIGLDIIKQRALRVRHSYSGKMNQLRIVQ